MDNANLVTPLSFDFFMDMEHEYQRRYKYTEIDYNSPTQANDPLNDKNE